MAVVGSDNDALTPARQRSESISVVCARTNERALSDIVSFDPGVAPAGGRTAIVKSENPYTIRVCRLSFQEHANRVQTIVRIVLTAGYEDDHCSLTIFDALVIARKHLAMGVT